MNSITDKPKARLEEEARKINENAETREKLLDLFSVFEQHQAALKIFSSWHSAEDPEGNVFFNLAAIADTFGRIKEPITELNTNIIFAEPIAYRDAEELRIMVETGDTDTERFQRIFEDFLDNSEIYEIINLIEWTHPEEENHHGEPQKMDLSYADTGKKALVPYVQSLEAYLRGTEAARANIPTPKEDPEEPSRMNIPVMTKNGSFISFSMPKQYIDEHPEAAPAIHNVFRLMNAELYKARSNPLTIHNIEENGIFISSREYARMTDPNPDEEKSASMRQLMTKNAKKELIDISRFLFSADATIKDNQRETHLHILRKYEVVRGGVVIKPETDLFKLTSGKVLTLRIPPDFFKFDKKHETARQIFAKLIYQAGQDNNIKRGNDRKISVSKLLDAVENIPSYETVMTGKRPRPAELIIDPLSRGLQYLHDTGLIKYSFMSNGQEVTPAAIPRNYQDFIALDIYFEILNGSDRQRVAVKKKYQQKNRRRAYAKAKKNPR